MKRDDRQADVGATDLNTECGTLTGSLCWRSSTGLPLVEECNKRLFVVALAFLKLGCPLRMQERAIGFQYEEMGIPGNLRIVRQESAVIVPITIINLHDQEMAT